MSEPTIRDLAEAYNTLLLQSLYWGEGGLEAEPPLEIKEGAIHYTPPTLPLAPTPETYLANTTPLREADLPGTDERMDIYEWYLTTSLQIEALRGETRQSLEKLAQAVQQLRDSLAQIQATHDRIKSLAP